MIRLGAGSISDMPSSAVSAFADDEGTADLEKLYDRMTSRLGPLAVVQSKPVNTHIPERAVRLEPVVARVPDKEPDLPAAAGARPLRLLPSPEPIGVVAEVPDGPPAIMTWRRVRYRFATVAGPERNEAEWWRSGQRLTLVPQLEKEPAPIETREGKLPLPPKPYVPALPVFDAAAMLRDYYVAEDEAGRRFWVFRQGLYSELAPPRWCPAALWLF
jgi:protein ImuB